MALRIRPNHSRDPLEAYAPAFDISNALPSICKGAVHGLKPEHWPAWMRDAAGYRNDGSLRYDSEDTHGALLLYIRALKEMQCDPDVRTVDEAFARTGFDRVEPALRAIVMARVMDYVNALFFVAIKDATELVEGGTPVRDDIQAALDIVDNLVSRQGS
jgi:hypothetical protein